MVPTTNEEEVSSGNYGFVNPAVTAVNPQPGTLIMPPAGAVRFNDAALYYSNQPPPVATADVSSSRFTYVEPPQHSALISNLYNRSNIMAAHGIPESRSHAFSALPIIGGDQIPSSSSMQGYYFPPVYDQATHYQSNRTNPQQHSLMTSLSPSSVEEQVMQVRLRQEKQLEESCAPKSRWVPAAEQIRVLESLFSAGTTTPSREQIAEITQHLKQYGSVGEANIFYWFQNRKARAKRKLRQAAATAATPSPNNPSSSNSGHNIEIIAAAAAASAPSSVDQFDHAQRSRRVSTKTSSGSSPSSDTSQSTESAALPLTGHIPFPADETDLAIQKRRASSAIVTGSSKMAHEDHHHHDRLNISQLIHHGCMPTNYSVAPQTWPAGDANLTTRLNPFHVSRDSSRIADQSSSDRQISGSLQPFWLRKTVEQQVLDPRMSLSLSSSAHVNSAGGSHPSHANAMRDLDPLAHEAPSAVYSSSVGRTDQISRQEEVLWDDLDRSSNPPASDWEGNRHLPSS